jgi:hypothetical protein
VDNTAVRAAVVGERASTPAEWPRSILRLLSVPKRIICLRL